MCSILNLGSTFQYKLVAEIFTLAEGKLFFDIWSTSRQPLTAKFYIFNITNPDQILNGAKPILQVLGPYTYRMFRWKIRRPFMILQS